MLLWIGRYLFELSMQNSSLLRSLPRSMTVVGLFLSFGRSVSFALASAITSGLSRVLIARLLVDDSSGLRRPSSRT